jgi:hypothetical protein
VGCMHVDLCQLFNCTTLACQMQACMVEVHETLDAKISQVSGACGEGCWCRHVSPVTVMCID